MFLALAFGIGVLGPPGWRYLRSTAVAREYSDLPWHPQAHEAGSFPGTVWLSYYESNGRAVVEIDTVRVVFSDAPRPGHFAVGLVPIDESSPLPRGEALSVGADEKRGLRFRFEDGRGTGSVHGTDFVVEGGTLRIAGASVTLGTEHHLLLLDEDGRVRFEKLLSEADR